MTVSIITSRLDGIRIGILHHSGSKLVRQGYLIDSMADLWKGRGAEVVDIVGTDTPVPVDLLLLHIDNSHFKMHSIRFVNVHYNNIT